MLLKPHFTVPDFILKGGVDMKVLSGKSLNAFTVSGQAFKFERKITTVSCIHTPSAEDEAGRFAAAQQTALEQLHELRDTAVSQGRKTACENIRYTYGSDA